MVGKRTRALNVLLDAQPTLTLHKCFMKLFLSFIWGPLNSCQNTISANCMRISTQKWQHKDKVEGVLLALLRGHSF